MKRFLLGLGLALPLAAFAAPPEQSPLPVAPGQVQGGRVLPTQIFLRQAAQGQATPIPDATGPDAKAAALADPQSDRPEEDEVPDDQAALQLEEAEAEAELAGDPAARPVQPGSAGTPKDPFDTTIVGVTPVLPETSALASAITPRPRARPAEVVQTARAAMSARRSGAVCGDLAIQGVAIGRVSASIAACGVAEAVRVSSVSGVALSTHAVMDCGTARALKAWVDGGLKPAVGSYGGGVRELSIAAHYICRPRNNRKGAKISEHGKGRAVDISGIKLVDGKELNVLKDWRRGREGRMLVRAHAAACGPFGTVLGPEANALHRDHFHFDTARYRNGSYCR